MSITDYVQLVAERIPVEEIGADSGQLINAFHFHESTQKSHGVPFKFLVKEVRQAND